MVSDPFIFDLFKRNRFIVVNKLARYIDDHKLYCDHALESVNGEICTIIFSF